MNARLVPWCLLAVAVAAFVVTLPAVRDRDSPVPDVRPAKSRVPALPRLPAGRDVVRMAPEEWHERFGQDLAGVDPDTRADILRLAGELQEMVAAGTDPRGEEARVYADAIRLLLADDGREDGSDFR